jgi:hypothetical protein
MNEHDAFEAELAALQPQPPSPELRQRVTDKLNVQVLVSSPPRSRRIWSSGAAIVGLVVACVIAALLLRPQPVGKPQSEFTFEATDLPVAAAFNDALPTVWTYQRALAGPPQEVEALLDKHAALTPPAGARLPTHLYIGLDTDHLFNGEL